MSASREEWGSSRSEPRGSTRDDAPGRQSTGAPQARVVARAGANVQRLMRRHAGIALLVIAACSDPPTPPQLGPIDQFTDEARRTYPTITELYQGERGIYRGCSPNGGVCHNSNEHPNLRTLGGVLDTIGADCNLKREPRTIDDMCERPGDAVIVGGEAIELGHVAPDERDATGRRWKLVLRAAPATVATYEELPVVRDGITVWPIGLVAFTVRDPDDASGRTLVVDPLPDDPNDPSFSPAGYLRALLVEAGKPGDAIQLGDPNRNGIFGADRGARLIKPGEPSESYLLRRLTDPEHGPLMPRANCCFWTKAALRAWWCWVDGLDAGGANALAAIDYDSCSPSPNIELLYPAPGPTCEAGGMCPVEALVEGSGTDFASIYREILVPRCSGSACHNLGPIAGVDFSTEDRAFATLSTKVVPGDPRRSRLMQRVDPALCTGDCRTMPLGRQPLSAAQLDRLRAWIEAGAMR